MSSTKGAVSNNLTDSLESVLSYLKKIPSLKVDWLIDPQKTAVIVIDMINGFTREGTLHSPRAAALIPTITKLIKHAHEYGIPVVAFADCHPEKSVEYETFPIHAKAGTSECELVDEIKALGRYHLINKNSTNGFLEEAFQTWLAENSHINTFIITGVCTDICILQFATTLKAYFNRKNQSSLIAVPIDAVDTYDAEGHNAKLSHIMALYFMKNSGVQLFSCVEY